MKSVCVCNEQFNKYKFLSFFIYLFISYVWLSNRHQQKIINIIINWINYICSTFAILLTKHQGHNLIIRTSNTQTNKKYTTKQYNKWKHPKKIRKTVSKAVNDSIKIKNKQKSLLKSLSWCTFSITKFDFKNSRNSISFKIKSE